MRWIGVDGCRGGWVHVSLDAAGSATLGLAATFPEVVWNRDPGDLVLVDIPIGLPGAGVPVRSCDVAARALLGRPRASSVFPPPTREALACASYTDACAVNEQIVGRRITRQAWALAPKIRDVDRIVRRTRRTGALIRETHPELVFWALEGGTALSESKRTEAGKRRRHGLLRSHIDIGELLKRARTTYPTQHVATDDVIDAAAAAVAARATRSGQLRSLPDVPPRDTAGVPMEIVYPLP